MLKIVKSEARGAAHHGWLISRHSFSFGGWHDPSRMGFGPLRVINEDIVAPGRGFGEHGHRDMEIISYPLSGALEHRDSLGSGEVVRSGEAQRMSAGSGARHSEFNASREEPVHFLQIWIEPSSMGGEPGYEQKSFSEESKRGRWALIASGDGREGSMSLRQDASLYAARLDGDERVELALAPGRLGYAHMARGRARVNGVWLEAGDALELTGEERLWAEEGSGAELLAFDLPAGAGR